VRAGADACACARRRKSCQYEAGNLPSVKHNFALVVAGIVVVSVLPVAFEVYKVPWESEWGRGGGSTARRGGAVMGGCASERVAQWS
jgi:hypothetical protein